MSQRPRRDGLKSPDTIALTVRLPRLMVEQARVLALDARTGKVRYRGWGQIFERALSEWIASQKLNKDQPQQPDRISL